MVIIWLIFCLLIAKFLRNGMLETALKIKAYTEENLFISHKTIYFKMRSYKIAQFYLNQHQFEALPVQSKQLERFIFFK